MENPRFFDLVDQLKASVPELTVFLVQDEMKAGRLCLIDIREPKERCSGFLAGSVGLSKGMLEEKIEALVPNVNTKIILYCEDGTRSMIAGDALQRMGYKDVSSMEGGYMAWLDKGLPVSK